MKIGKLIKSTLEKQSNAAKKAAKVLMRANGYTVKISELKAAPQYNEKGHIVAYFVQSDKISLFVFCNLIPIQ
jgi:hypothetical protein